MFIQQVNKSLKKIPLKLFLTWFTIFHIRVLVSHDADTCLESNPLICLAGAGESLSSHTDLITAATLKVSDAAGGAGCATADCVF